LGGDAEAGNGGSARKAPSVSPAEVTVAEAAAAAIVEAGERGIRLKTEDESAGLDVYANLDAPEEATIVAAAATVEEVAASVSPNLELASAHTGDEEVAVKAEVLTVVEGSSDMDTGVKARPGE
jgi:hypothetical protein